MNGSAKGVKSPPRWRLWQNWPAGYRIPFNNPNVELKQFVNTSRDIVSFEFLSVSKLFLNQYKKLLLLGSTCWHIRWLPLRASFSSPICYSLTLYNFHQDTLRQCGHHHNHERAPVTSRPWPRKRRFWRISIPLFCALRLGWCHKVESWGGTAGPDFIVQTNIWMNRASLFLLLLLKASHGAPWQRGDIRASYRVSSSVEMFAMTKLAH